nr:PTS sugar transporter subunit IIA [uncultured Cetobacterium sp.]
MKKRLEGNINIVKEVDNWREGVRLSGKPLLEKNVIESSYIEAAIKNIEKLGTYIILTDGVAMPHARPEDGAKEIGVSLLVIKDGVSFSEDEELVKLIFMLASKDNNSHIEVIKKLSNMIDDEELLENIINSKNEQEILNLL